MKRSDAFLMSVIFVLIGMSIGGAIYPMVNTNPPTMSASQR